MLVYEVKKQFGLCFIMRRFKNTDYIFVLHTDSFTFTTIKNGKIEKYRVNLQMTFEVMPPKAADKASRAKKK